MVPVYEEDEPNTRRKVQRITSPEKWELKQVNIHSQKKTNTIILDKLVTHLQYKVSVQVVMIGTSVKQVHIFLQPPMDRCSHVLKHFQNSDSCRISCSPDCSKVFFYFAASEFQAEFFKSFT